MFSTTQFIKFGHDASANCQAQFAFFEGAFREMFNLLEEHAPKWYTEEHHKRAVAALGASKTLDNSAQLKPRDRKRQVNRPSIR
jgi:hypothetical protein